LLYLSRTIDLVLIFAEVAVSSSTTTSSSSSSSLSTALTNSFVPSFAFASADSSSLGAGGAFSAGLCAELPGVLVALLAGEDVAEIGPPLSFSLASSASIFGGKVGDSMSGRSHLFAFFFFFFSGVEGLSVGCEDSKGFVGESKAGRP
jgi:hypothetical protein